MSAVIGSGVALLNVFIVAQLMFISTSHDLQLLIALIAFSAIVTVFFSLWIASAVAGRIRTVAAGIRSLATGNYATRVHVAGGDEVTQLAEDTNALACRLGIITEQREALDRERRELTAAISHDLRTPLASVRAMVGALDDEVVQDPAEVRRYYRTVRREVERLSRMIDDLFELARMDPGALQLDRRPLALQEIAAEVADAMQPQARRKGVTLNLSAEEKLPEASLDGPRIERVVANLIRNALEHTSTRGRVEVDVFADNECVGLRVSDSGEGIAPADLPHIWERFYRADKSRRRSPQEWNGAGLGLAIVRGIIEAHGGTVEASSVVGRGTTFTVRLLR